MILCGTILLPSEGTQQGLCHLTRLKFEMHHLCLCLCACERREILRFRCGNVLLKVLKFVIFVCSDKMLCVLINVSQVLLNICSL